MVDADRSLAFHEGVMGLVAAGGGGGGGGGSRLRSVWLPDWAVPPHQLVQWQLQVAEVSGRVGVGKRAVGGEKQAVGGGKREVGGEEQAVGGGKRAVGGGKR